jgi:hypothetical protein
MDPVIPPLDRLPGLLRDVWRRMGADWSAGHRQRRLLLDAGFARAENYAAADLGGTPALDRGFLLFERSLRQDDFRTAAVESELADEALLDALLAEFQAFCKRPDAFFAVLSCSALGWAKEPPR